MIKPMSEEEINQVRRETRRRIVTRIREWREGAPVGMPDGYAFGGSLDHIHRVFTDCADDEALATLMIVFVGDWFKEREAILKILLGEVA